MNDSRLCDRCDSSPCVCPAAQKKRAHGRKSARSSGIVPEISDALEPMVTPPTGVSIALLRSTMRSDEGHDFDTATRVASADDLRDGLVASTVDGGDFDAATRVASVDDLRAGLAASTVDQAAAGVDPFETKTREVRVPGVLDALDDALGEALANAADDVTAASNVRSPFETGEGARSDDPWFDVATSGSFRLDKLLRASDADAVVLGDPTDVTGSFEIEIVSEDGEPIVRQIHLGGDVEKNLEEQTVLVRTDVEVGVHVLSPFERFVLQRVDGRKTISTIQTEMRLSENDLRIALALLLDKRLLRPVVVLSSDDIPSTPASAVAPAPTAAVAPARVPAAVAPAAVAPAGTQPPPPVIVSSSPVIVAAPSPPSPSPSFAPPPPVIVSSSPVIVTAPSSPSPSPSFAPPPPSSAPASSAPASSAPASSAPPPPPVIVKAPSSSSSSAAAAPPPPASSTVSSPPPAQLKSATAIRGSTPTAARSFDRPSTSQAGRSLIIDNAQVRAAALFDQSIREVKNGAFDKARGLLEQAASLAPNEDRYRAAVASWDDFVATHKTPEDMRALALAVRTEDAGDLVKATALLRQATQLNPGNVAAWNRLGLILARQKDARGAVDALAKAVELAPHDAGILSNFTKIAGAAEKEGVDVGLRGLWKRLVK